MRFFSDLAFALDHMLASLLRPSRTTPNPPPVVESTREGAVHEAPAVPVSDPAEPKAKRKRKPPPDPVALVAAEAARVAGMQAKRERATELGIVRYQWSTCGDERVCSECHQLDGKFFRYDEPPPHGHPGEREGCRCVPLSVLDDADERELRAASRQRQRLERAEMGRVSRSRSCSEDE